MLAESEAKWSTFAALSCQSSEQSPKQTKIVRNSRERAPGARLLFSSEAQFGPSDGHDPEAPPQQFLSFHANLNGIRPREV